MKSRLPLLARAATLLAVGLGVILLRAAAAASSPAVPSAPESHPGIRVEPTLLTVADGTRLRAIVTKPANAPPAARLPAVLFVQWLSCDSVAIPTQNPDGWAAMLERLVRESGAVVWRTDKRGVGGSEGRCDTLDYETELADHRAALEALRRRPDVDPQRIVIFGGSMGSNFAPLLAQDQPDLAGVIVWGGGARTWAERTLALERNRLELGDDPPATRAAEITARYRLLDRFLIGGQTPQAIAAEDPALAATWRKLAGASEHALYGRPFAFHWQAQRQNWIDAWTRVRAPVLAMVGANDWFEEPGGVALIGEVLNRRTPGQATVVVVPGLDHHLSRYPDKGAAFRGRGGTVAVAPVMDVVLPWLRGRFAAPRGN